MGPVIACGERMPGGETDALDLFDQCSFECSTRAPAKLAIHDIHSASIGVKACRAACPFSRKVLNTRGAPPAFVDNRVVSTGVHASKYELDFVCKDRKDLCWVTIDELPPWISTWRASPCPTGARDVLPEPPCSTSDCKGACD